MTAVSEAHMPNAQVDTDSRPLMTSPHALATAGIKANRKAHFTITLSGKELYEVLQMLEQAAVDAQTYSELRSFALAAEVIRNQADAQGFGLNPKQPDDDFHVPPANAPTRRGFTQARP